MRKQEYFASDNNSGVHPRIFDAIARANQGSCPAYGEDRWTEEAVRAVQDVFGREASPWFVLLGTAANVLGLKSLVRPHHGILCSQPAHINTDECGAPEAALGSKLVALPAPDGKIDLAACEAALRARESVHQSYPLVLSITQCTELGTTYSLEELRRIGEFCRAHDLYFHMDGARLCNAAASLEASLKSMTADVGVDILSFGGTKNGLMLGEAVIFFKPGADRDFGHIRKQNMQLASKMRFVAAQFTEYLQGGIWLENARHANAMAALLAENIRGLDHLKIVHPVQANMIFARMPDKSIARLHKDFYFYVIDEADAPGYPEGWPLVRLMTSFCTTEAQTLEFAKAIRNAHE